MLNHSAPAPHRLRASSFTAPQRKGKERKGTGKWKGRTLRHPFQVQSRARTERRCATTTSHSPIQHGWMNR